MGVRARILHHARLSRKASTLTDRAAGSYIHSNSTAISSYSSFSWLQVEAMNAPPKTPPEGPTILAVDDEELVRHFMQRTLRGAGYQVVLASNGFEALALLRVGEAAIDLVITDLRMPGMRGEELGVKIGQLPSPPPVLYVSASNEPPPGDPEVQFLEKPFAPADLIRVVKQILSTRKTNTGTP
jgi:CheY-like chemotaxis protein